MHLLRGQTNSFLISPNLRKVNLGFQTLLSLQLHLIKNTSHLAHYMHKVAIYIRNAPFKFCTCAVPTWIEWLLVPPRVVIYFELRFSWFMGFRTSFRGWRFCVLVCNVILKNKQTNKPCNFLWQNFIENIIQEKYRFWVGLNFTSPWKNWTWIDGSLLNQTL